MMIRKDYCGNHWFNIKGKNKKKKPFSCILTSGRRAFVHEFEVFDSLTC